MSERIEDAGLFRGRFAAREAQSEESRVFAGAARRRQETGEERLVSGVGKAAGRVTFLPAATREDGGQVRRATLAARASWATS